MTLYKTLITFRLHFLYEFCFRYFSSKKIIQHFSTPCLIFAGSNTKFYQTILLIFFSLFFNRFSSIFFYFVIAQECLICRINKNYNFYCPIYLYILRSFFFFTQLIYTFGRNSDTYSITTIHLSRFFKILFLFFFYLVGCFAIFFFLFLFKI